METCPLKLHVIPQLLLPLLLCLQRGDALVELVHGRPLLDGLGRRCLALCLGALRTHPQGLQPLEAYVIYQVSAAQNRVVLRALAPALLGLPAFCGLGGIAARVPLPQRTSHIFCSALCCGALVARDTPGAAAAEKDARNPPLSAWRRSKPTFLEMWVWKA